MTACAGLMLIGIIGLASRGAIIALAAILGAMFILDDPIFNGLAIALISGILVSTLLTLIVIPVMFYAFNYRRLEAEDQTLIE